MPVTFNIYPKKGQTALEIALEYYGSIDGIAYLIEDNPDLANYIGMPYISSQSLKIRVNYEIDNRVVKHFVSNKLHPSGHNSYLMPISTGGIDPVIDVPFDVNITYYENE